MFSRAERADCATRYARRIVGRIIIKTNLQNLFAIAERKICNALAYQWHSTLDARADRHDTAKEMRAAIVALRSKVSGNEYDAGIVRLFGNGETTKDTRIVGSIATWLDAHGYDPRVVSAQITMGRTVARWLSDPVKFAEAVENKTALRPLYTAAIAKPKTADAATTADAAKPTGAVLPDQARNISNDWINAHLMDAIAMCDAAAKHAADSILLDRLAPAMQLVAERRKVAK